MRRARKGQFIILGALIIVISLLFVMAAYSFATIYRVKLVKEDFRAVVFKISSDLRMALEASTAEASKRWRYGYVDYEQYGNDLLMKWVRALVEEYSGLGLKLNLTFPVNFELKELMYQGYASASVSMSLNLTRHGLYGWKDMMSVEDDLWVNSSSVRRTGDQVLFNFTLLKEDGEPVAGLTTEHITVYMREEQAFRRYIDPSNITLTYLGNGEYSVSINTGTYDLILYNLDVLKLIVEDYPDEYFNITKGDPDELRENLTRLIDEVINYVNSDEWGNAYNTTLMEIRPKLDITDPGSWMNDTVADTDMALMIIDETLGYMLPTFELIVYDERGIVTMCFVSFEGVIDAIGPVVKEVVISPAIAQKSVDTTVTLRALIDDSETGNSNIEEAEFFINEEHTYGTGYAMSPENPPLDSPTEWMTASIDITGWDIGDYVFLVHGKDEHGNWGKITMVILRIRDNLPPTIGDAVFYLNQTLYPEPYTDENGTLGAAELSVNVTDASDIGNGDSTITAIECRLYNSSYTTGWTLLNPVDGSYDEPTEDARGDISITGLSPGLYTLHVRAMDEYGNQASLYYSVKITRDFIGPKITYGILYNSTHQGDVIETYGEPVGINVTAEDVGNAGYNVTAVRFLLKNQGTGEETDWFYLNASDGGFDEREEDATGVITVDGLPPGTYTVVVQAVDSGGNVGANYTALTVIRLADILGPEVVSLSTELNKTVKTLNVTALVSDEGRGGSNITLAQCRLYNSTFTTGWLDMTALDGSYDSPTEWVYTFIDASALSPGVYTVEVGAVDSMGNISENRTVQVLIDFEPPEIYALYGPVYNPASKTLSVEANVTDIGHGGSNITIARCRLYNDTYDSGWVDMVAVKGVYNATSEVRVNGTIDLTGLTSGVYSLEVEGYDSAWNRGNVTVENIQLDLEAPAILNLEALYNSTGLELNVTALVSDIGRGGSDITRAWCRVLDSWGTPVTDWMEMSAKDGSYDSPEEWVEYIFSNLDLYPGIYTVVVNATDSAGNMGNNATSFLAEGWLTGWQYRKSHTIIGSTAGAVTDYQVKITVHYGAGTDSGADVYLDGKCQPDFDDIRFTASDGKTLLSYWIEEKVDGNYAIVWVKIPSIPEYPDSVIIYLYYGNLTATSISDGESTFPFFDDMESGDGKWSRTGLWHLTTKKSYSPSHSFWYGQESTNNYDTGSRNYGELKTDDLPGLSSAKLELRYWRQVEYYAWGDYDVTEIYDSVDGMHWNRLWRKTSRNPSEESWTFLSIDLTPNARYLKFYFDTIDRLYNDYWGWFIDDVRIRNYIDPEPSHGGWGPEESISP
ncbi:MAG: hypothetical protein AYL29_005860 [Candidatus Bathyarchaeota archaeon B24]|nr:MAG: hypothetical protein AYL29_005860 [Candidatus Bathyarchaeota archaeon B24]